MSRMMSQGISENAFDLVRLGNIRLAYGSEELLDCMLLDLGM